MGGHTSSGRPHIFSELSARWIWKHCNAYTFNCSFPSVSELLHEILDEAQLSCLVGDNGLRALWLYQGDHGNGSGGSELRAGSHGGQPEQDRFRSIRLGSSAAGIWERCSRE